MSYKENQVRNVRQRQMLTATADVSRVLRTITQNNTHWKNTSSKFTKTINPQTLIKNLMTQDDLDKLFNRSKQKLKTEATAADFSRKDKKKPVPYLNTQISEPLWSQSNKDFLQKVKFLQFEEDNEDKYLTGLQNYENQNHIQLLFDQQQQQPNNDLTSQFKKNYFVGKIIGQGAYASVRVAIYKPLNLKIAIKVYQKIKIKEPQRKKSVRRQIRILQTLSHPNIVKIHDVVQTNNHLNIIMEHLSGISLNNYLKSLPGHKAPQKICRKIIKPLAQALNYMHQRQIAHRDIKLENIIIDQQTISPKLIDFGFSTCIEKFRKVKIFCGTPSYMAPQIVQKKQFRGQPADVWALGVLFYVVLTGFFPFKGDTDLELYRKINTADYQKNSQLFSRQAADLISKMLEINVQDRITAEEMLTHCWLRNCSLSINKKSKRTQFSAEVKKRVGVSKQNDDQTHMKKFLGIKQHKLDLKIPKSSSGMNNTFTQRCSGRQLNKTLKPAPSATLTASAQLKKEVFYKTSSRVLDLLKAQSRGRPQSKSKSKTRKF